MKFYNYLIEKLSLSVAKKYRKMWTNEIQDRYKDLFNGKYRIYLPVKNNPNSVKPNDQVINQLKELGYMVTDYAKGLASKDGKNPVRIGKLLSKFPDILKLYQTDPAKQGSKQSNLLVVISRHPYDLAGMSTDRGWRSCMNLVDGVNRHYVCADIKQGTLIAYLIKSDDKNIQKPIARILIKPYYNEENLSDLLLVRENTIYGVAGVASKAFSKTVDDWLDSFQSKKQGVFKFNDKLYQDNSPTTILKNVDFKKYYNNLPENKKKIFRNFKTFDNDIIKLVEILFKNKLTWIYDVNISENSELSIQESSKDNKGNISYIILFVNGIFKDGYWKEGRWKNGTWLNGTWVNGIWDNGTWEDGEWKMGTWNDGVWKGGNWKYGHFNNGTWEDGNWEDGTWDNGTWENGIWKDGSWHIGTWKDGTWENGFWENGVWENGTWKDGTWRDGTWKNGTWKGGKWLRGTWEDGSWENGKIGSFKFNRYFKSKVNPVVFKNIEKNENNVENFVKRIS